MKSLFVKFNVLMVFVVFLGGVFVLENGGGGDGVELLMKLLCNGGGGGGVELLMVF